MPKMKTHSGAKKKFKVTATGKVLRRNGNQSHLLEHKSPKQKRSFSKETELAPGQAKVANRQLGRS